MGVDSGSCRESLLFCTARYDVRTRESNVVNFVIIFSVSERLMLPVYDFAVDKTVSQNISCACVKKPLKLVHAHII